MSMAATPPATNPKGRRPSVVIVETDEPGKHDGDSRDKLMPSRRHSVDHTGERLLMFQPLPTGSSAFQEVMAELNPPAPAEFAPHPELSRPIPARRRSMQAHVHYITETVLEDGQPVVQIKSSVTEPAESSDPHHPHHHHHDHHQQLQQPQQGPQPPILHGRCHCYFVNKGGATGLADRHCQHEHRPQGYHHLPPLAPAAAAAAAGSGSHTPGFGQPTSFPSSRPGGGVRKLSNASAHPPTFGAVTSSSPAGSPGARRRSQQPPLHPHLISSGEDRFRARSNSDVTGLLNFSSALKHSVQTEARRRSPERRASLAPRNSSSFETPDYMSDEAIVLAEKISASLRLGPDPSASTRNGTGTGTASDDSSAHPGGESPRRKLSSVQTEQLHFLYDQLLPSGHAQTASGSSDKANGRARSYTVD